MSSDITFLKRKYNEDEEFKEYVRKYCATRRISILDGLNHIMVKDYYKYLVEKRSLKNDDQGIFSR